MADLAQQLDAPITWMKTATDPDLKAMLEDLQANILKGHGRQHVGHIFLGFAGMEPADVARLVRDLASHCTSAYHQLRTNRRNPPHLDGGPVRCLFLSASGYEALNGLATVPPGAAFRAGMAGRAKILADPPRSAWNRTGWQGPPPDAMFLLADADEGRVTEDLEAAERWLGGTGANILVVERGLQQTRSFRPGIAEGVEHFGYVDGRSQPLFLTEDIAVENVPPDPAGTKPGDKVHWDPVFKPSQFIVPDPNGRTRFSAGSYFVFRKLEQNVRGFNAAEDALGKEIFGADASRDQLDRAGAMVVGRFEDGTPLVLADTGEKQPVTNDFTYAHDSGGAKCPFHAHIRKVNPRGDIERLTETDDAAPGRIHIMARRGITYGPKRPHNADGSEFADGGAEPEKNVGLLFMAYMASIEDQFEFTQQGWADKPTFAGNISPARHPHPLTGVDPIIGQTGDDTQREHTYQDGWTPGSAPKVLNFANFVTMQGGEYFFAPSLSFLRGIGL